MRCSPLRIWTCHLTQKNSPIPYSETISTRSLNQSLKAWKRFWYSKSAFSPFAFFFLSSTKIKSYFHHIYQNLHRTRKKSMKNNTFHRPTAWDWFTKTLTSISWTTTTTFKVCPAHSRRVWGESNVTPYPCKHIGRFQETHIFFWGNHFDDSKHFCRKKALSRWSKRNNIIKQ